MNRFLLVVPIFAMAACATSGQEASRSASVQAAETAPISEEPRASEVVQVSAVAAVGELDDDAPTRITEEQYAGVIDDLESPDASEIPAEMIPGRPTLEPAIVCEKVVPTGSVIPVRVCRHADYAKRKQDADQEIFDDIKRNTAIFNSRL